MPPAQGGLAISLYDHQGMQLLRSFGATPWLFPLLPEVYFPTVEVRACAQSSPLLV